MVNYNEGKIYKIVCNKTGLCYIGSTTKKKLSDRLCAHVYNYKKHKEGNRVSYVTSFKVLENEDYDIVLLELYPCNSKDELHARERHYIETMECVNKYIPTRTLHEWYQQYKVQNRDKIIDYQKQYREQHKDKIKEKARIYRKQNTDKHKEYREAHKEEIKEKNKKYYEEHKEQNKDIMKERGKKYREQNKDKIKEKARIYRKQNTDKIQEYYKKIRDKLHQKFNCDCGGKYVYSTKQRHFKSTKHQEWEEQQKQP